MNFEEKIDKLLKTNEKDLRSLGQLETFLGLGTHTIRSAIKEKREPSRKIQVKIVEGLGVNWDWWDTGEGDIFDKKGTSVKEYSMTEEVATLVSHFNDTLEGYRLDIERLKQEKRELEEKLKRAKPGKD